EIKDVAIRGGLHVLSKAPEDESLIGTVTTMLRARQLWGGKQTLPGLREALGLAEDGTDERHTVDSIDALATALVTAVVKNPDQPVAQIAADVLGSEEFADIAAPNGLDQVVELLQFTRDEILPRLAATSEEIPRILSALDGVFVPAGPSGSPLRGLVNVLPTARNFYSVDPKAVPSRLAWETGVNLADGLIERYRADHGEYPKSVGLSVWGTSAMRTSGDDIAEVLALIGVHPVWDDASRRIVGLEPIPLEELGRPRIDVTVRISGF
ncbi:cobaltochelatase subunit CobN, partial [Corynebacterium amycolatum]|uniref:cobaltochelatase subunit CobN n=1 Tax=Corynebacterium amycolatum TaxID=43765 RepID=UPI002119C6A6